MVEINKKELGGRQKNLLKALADLPVCGGKKTSLSLRKEPLKNHGKAIGLTIPKVQTWVRKVYSNQPEWKDLKIHKTNGRVL